MGNYIPSTREENNLMLSEIGCASTDELFSSIPDEALFKGDLNLPKGKSELEVKKVMEKISKENVVFTSIFRGAGAYHHYIPAIVKSIAGKEEFLTAYTPYQAEISQGILQSIFEYQTMICQLTGMDASNASMYDGASAAAEATVMCHDRKREKIVVSETIDPQVMKTVETYCYGNGTELVKVPAKEGKTDMNKLYDILDSTVAGLYVQHPNYFGLFEDADALGEAIHAVGGKYILGVNPISLGLVKSPREYGADIAVGEGQPLGLPMSFGGPYLGFMTCTQELERKLPGRIVGQTTDINGNRAFVLTLQAREQHIRREKAKSNICSNQAHCALTAAAFMAALGRSGLRDMAMLNLSKAHYLAEELKKIGFKPVYGGEFFNEFVTGSPVDIKLLMTHLESKGILGGLPLENEYAGQILWCCTEMNAKEDMDILVSAIKEVM